MFQIFLCVMEYKVALKPLLQQGLSEPEFYGTINPKINKSRADFSYSFRKIIKRYKSIGYNIKCNRPTAEKANFESLIGLVFNLLSVKVFDKNRKI